MLDNLLTVLLELGVFMGLIIGMIIIADKIEKEQKKLEYRG
jgi:hypothetical protein